MPVRRKRQATIPVQTNPAGTSFHDRNAPVHRVHGDMSINLRRLRAFVTVAETRSVTLAAKALHLTPPAVTKSVRELEVELGTELFRRTAGGMLLTTVGEAFQFHAKKALTEVERGREEVRLLMGGEGGRVRFGATSEAAMHVLPIALGRLIEQRPQIEVAMLGGLFETLASEVRTGKLDFFLGVVPPDGISGGLRSEALYFDEVQVIARRGHPLASCAELKLADLMPYRWALSVSRGPTDRLLRISFEEAGLAFPENSIVIMPLTPMRAILSYSNLIAAATSVRMMEELALGQLVALPVKLPSTRHTVSIVSRKEAYLSPWAKELIELLEIVAGECGVRK